MIHWLFGNIIKKSIKKEMELIHNALDNSFGNIKKDFLNIHQKINFQEEKYEKLVKKIGVLEKYIERSESSINETLIEEEYPSTKSKISESEWNSLTERQRDILRVLVRLQTEGGKEWVSLKQLVEDMYHDKNYDDIRPLVSSYISVLIEHNLAKKKRVGKHLFVSLSEKSYSYINKLPESKKKKILMLQKEVD